MPCFQRVHRLRLSCRLASRLLTRCRVFFIFAHTAKNRRIPPPLSSKDMLGGNYLIAQQLPASSPFLQAITVYIMRQIYARAFFIFFQVFLACKSSVFNMYMVRLYDTHPRVLFWWVWRGSRACCRRPRKLAPMLRRLLRRWRAPAVCLILAGLRGPSLQKRLNCKVLQG